MARILVVDDEPDERFLVSRVLRREGHEVAVAGDGAAALEVVREWSPELVVTDIMMPVMDGVEFIRRPRGDPATPIDWRWLRVVKMRGRSHRSGKHTSGSARPASRCSRASRPWVPQVEAPLTGQVPSGIPGLDALMGGGARQSDASLVTGPSGVGKTIFGLRGSSREWN